MIIRAYDCSDMMLVQMLEIAPYKTLSKVESSSDWLELILRAVLGG